MLALATAVGGVVHSQLLTMHPDGIGCKLPHDKSGLGPLKTVAHGCIRKKQDKQTHTHVAFLL